MATLQSLVVCWLFPALAFCGCLVFSETVKAGSSVSIVGTPPSNDDCANATPFVLQGYISGTGGTTTGATLDVVPPCGVSVVNPGVWFSIIGNGSLLEIDTCVEPGHPTNHNVSVFCGDCTDLHCRVQGPLVGFCPNSVGLCTEVGVEYFILVHGVHASGGGFSLVFTDWGPCANPDPCPSAVGACCTDPVNETCVEVSSTGCAALGGTYQGDNTTCSGADCGFATFCDASDGALASCPCGNPGDPDSGCDIQQGTGGILLSVTHLQTSPPNRATLAGTGFPPASAPAAIAVRAPGIHSASPIVFGDGLRCVGVPTVRLGVTLATAGTSNHTFGHGSMAGSGDFYYQIWARNTPAMYCTPDAFNLSNGRIITW
jgi:hypothetical protein